MVSLHSPCFHRLCSKLSKWHCPGWACQQKWSWGLLVAFVLYFCSLKIKIQGFLSLLESLLSSLYHQIYFLWVLGSFLSSLRMHKWLLQHFLAHSWVDFIFSRYQGKTFPSTTVIRFHFLIVLHYRWITWANAVLEWHASGFPCNEVLPNPKYKEFVLYSTCFYWINLSKHSPCVNFNLSVFGIWR